MSMQIVHEKSRAHGVDDVLIFNHIPKTAGSTFKNILWRQYGSNSVFFSMTPEHHKKRLAEFGVQLSKKDRSRVLVTHSGYGVHELLPDSFNYRYVTFLRHPIERVISGYAMFVRQGKVPPDMTLDEFVQHVPKPSWNMQTSYLSGYFLECHLERKDPDWASFGTDMLDRAKENLDRHAVVGLTENFDDTLLMMRRRFGWTMRGLAHARANVGSGKKKATEYPEEVLETVTHYNKLDTELYRYGELLFDREVAEYGPRIERDRSLLSLMNRLYSSAAPVAIPFARRLGLGKKRRLNDRHHILHE